MTYLELVLIANEHTVKSQHLTYYFTENDILNGFRGLTLITNSD